MQLKDVKNVKLGDISNKPVLFINCLIVGDLILRRLHGDSICGIKLIESMAATSELNLLIIFQVYDHRVFGSAIHSHAIFGCDNRNGDQVGYAMWVVVHFKVWYNM